MNASKIIATRARMVSATGCFDHNFDGIVLSPCVSVCRMTPDKTMCEGCFRSLEEIRVWSGATSAERRAIWLRLLERAQLTPPAALLKAAVP